MVRRLVFLLLVGGRGVSALTVPSSAIASIRAGRCAVLEGWLPVDEVAALREDASALHRSGAFSENSSTDLADDRSVLRLGDWNDRSLGDGGARARFVSRLDALRTSLASALNRPRLLAAVPQEVSYSRYGRGASLARHIDEHHEELKGVAGWRAPGRRSVSWLVYLNEGWAASDGGALRVYERRRPPAATPTGATAEGDLQVGWLAGERAEAEAPVFLAAVDGRAHGLCRLYAEPGRRTISRDFRADPVLFLADGGTDAIVKRTLLLGDARETFVRLEPLKSRAPLLGDALHAADFAPVDVLPRAGTLVLFDSVTLPHEVRATVGRERFACSGWFHEAQQPLRSLGA